MPRRSAYTDFVRKNYDAMRKKHTRPQDRIKAIAALWRAHRDKIMAAPSAKPKPVKKRRRAKKKTKRSDGDGAEDSSGA